MEVQMNEEDILEVDKRVRHLAHNRVYAKDKILKSEILREEQWLDKRIPKEIKEKLFADFFLFYAVRFANETLTNFRVDCRSCVWNGMFDIEGKKKKTETAILMCPYPFVRNATGWCPQFSPVNENAKKMLDKMGKNRKKAKEAYDTLNEAMKVYHQAHLKTTNKGG